MTDGQPIPFGNELVDDVVSTEMTNDENRANQVVSPDTTEQPNWLGLNAGGQRTASADAGGR